MKIASCKGQLVKWKDDRGFGFIKPEVESKEVFLHISALASATRRPKVGDTILYDQAINKDGKISATNASIQGVSSQNIIKPQRIKSQYIPTKQKTDQKSSLQIGGSILGIAALGFLIISSNRNLFSGCNVKGNISVSSGAKFYHIQGMPEYEITRINTSKGERFFCSESEAIANGWSKAPR